MKAIFHIGHHKTGTTSLQAYLAANAGRLLEAGVLSPWVESQGAVWAQARALHGDSIDASIEPDLLPINVREPHNALAFRMLADARPEQQVPTYHPGLPASPQMLLAIRNQIEILGPETVVLCSEVMSHFGAVAPQLIDRLARSFVSADFRLHITLRRPDEQLIAWHGQSLRFGDKAPALSVPEHGINFAGIHVDYRQVIEPWLERLPDPDASLRPYCETMAAGGAIDDFFATQHIPRPAQEVPVPALNKGVPTALLTLLRVANHKLPGPAAKALGEQLDVFAKGLELPAASEIEFFGPSARTRLVETFAPIHDWLSEHSARASFFNDIDDMARLRPISEGEALRSALDQVTPERIALLQGPALRDFMTETRNSFRPAPLP